MPLESLKGIYYLNITWNTGMIYRGPLGTVDPTKFRRGAPSPHNFMINTGPGELFVDYPLSKSEIHEITRRTGMTLGRRNIIAFDSVKDAAAVATLIEASDPSDARGSVKVSVKSASTLPEFQFPKRRV